MLDYTPTQLQALVFLGRYNYQQELSDQLVISRAAAHGDADTLKSLMRNLERVEP